jgi:hypothetical protein
MFRQLTLVGLLLVSASAAAGVSLNCSPLTLAPNPAIAGEPVIATLSCQCLTPPQGPVNVDRSANTVTISYEAGAGCIVPIPPPPVPVDFDIGAFPPGEFSIIVAPVAASNGAALPAQEALLGVRPAAIPAASGPLLGACLMAILLLGLYHLTNRSSTFRA